VNKKSLAKLALGTWVNTLCQGNPVKMAKLYAGDGVLVGTFAPGPVQGSRPILAYFQNLMKKDEVCARITSMKVQRIPGGAILSGNYTFMWKDELGRPEQAKARYTFVVDANVGRVDGQPYIIHHHSSLVPNRSLDTLHA